LISFLVVVALIFAACGGSNSSSSASNGGTPIPTPTQMSGSFTAVGEQSVLTDTAELLETASVTESASSANTNVDLSVGERSYTKNKCGDCHGAKGEGVADKGNAIAATSLSLEEFDKVLRTGGGLGNSHIFGRSAVSPSGMEALYAYVQSLGQ
jgi:mono/diheme cytochrome c family protein